MLSVRQTHLHSWIVAFFIVFSLADLSGMTPCCDEQNGLPPYGAGTIARSAVAGQPSIVTVADSSPRQEPAPTTDEDCFCCCAHILPACDANLVAPVAASLVTDPREALLPTPPPSRTFHPPRLA